MPNATSDIEKVLFAAPKRLEAMRRETDLRKRLCDQLFDECFSKVARQLGDNGAKDYFKARAKRLPRKSKRSTVRKVELLVIFFDLRSLYEQIYGHTHGARAAIAELIHTKYPGRYGNSRRAIRDKPDSIEKDTQRKLRK